MSSQPLPVGEELRRAREDAGLDLADVAAHLRIRSNFLSALEEGRPDALPGITYAIGYVRTYAAFLGLEPDAAVRRFKEEAAGLNSKTQLVFPSPAPEGRVPGLVLMLVAVMLAGGAYGGWYWLSERDGSLRDLVPAVPERLAQLIEGGAPSLPPAATAPVPTAPVPTAPVPAASVTAPAATPSTKTAGSYADANPAGVAVPRAAPSPVPAPQPAATAPATAPAAPVAAAPGATTAKPAEAKPATIAAAPAAGTAPAPTATDTTPTAPTTIVASSEIAPQPAEQAPATAPAATATVDTSVRTAADDTPDVTAPPEPASAASDTISQTAAVTTESAAEAAPTATAPTAAKPTAAKPTAAAPTTAAPTAGAKPASAEEEVPAAPRIAALIGSSEAAVPSGHTTAGPIDRVLIKATGDSWVQVRDAQGTALFTRVLREGDIYRVPEQAGLRLATGNAGALQILVDGNPAPSLGGYGEVVRNIQLDPEKLAAGTATSSTR